MTTEQGGSYALGRLILDYLRTFMWPLLIAGLLLGYGDKVWDLLGNREVEVAGLFKIGQQVAQIKENTNEELNDIRALLGAVRNGDGSTTKIVRDIEAKLGKVERNLEREVRQINSADTTQAAPSPSAKKSITAPKPAPAAAAAKAQVLERQGFEALLKRDVAAARKAFGAAFAAYPEYHNVKEIGALLESKHTELADPRSLEWDRLNQRILTDLSWGMPSELRPRFRSAVTRSYSR